MKKLICIVCCVVLVASLAAAFVGCQKVPRDQVLKLYLPGEYMDYDIFEGFEAWYEEQTGKKVTVVEYKEFENVEDIQLAVEGSKADYDLLCPSDYMVEYLIKKDLLLPVDKDILDIEEEGLFRSEYIQTTKQFDDKLTYAVPYMYGTLGLVYNRKKTGGEVNSWSALFDATGTNTISIKKSMRDAYCAACLYNARDQLVGLSGEEQKAAVQRIFELTDSATVQAAKDTLNRAKASAVWDNDDVKYEMAANNIDVKVALMWSCDAGYVMNDYEDEDGNPQEGNHDLWYVVPEEGGNVYIDCFVISKYAKNVTAAQYFLAYLCQKEVAVQNSEYAGAISPVAEAYDELYEYYQNDEDGIFEGTDEGWKEMFIETMFPSQATLNRCGVMKDFGDGKNTVTKMWQSLMK